MDGSLQLIGSEAEDIGVDLAVEHHRVLLHHGLQHLDLVPKSGGLLELELRAGLFHVARELGDIRRPQRAGYDADKAFGHAAMVGGADVPDARCRAFADRRQQTRPVSQLCLAERAVGTCAHGKAGQQFVQ